MREQEYHPGLVNSIPRTETSLTNMIVYGGDVLRAMRRRERKNGSVELYKDAILPPHIIREKGKLLNKLTEENLSFIDRQRESSLGTYLENHEPQQIWGAFEDGLNRSIALVSRDPGMSRKMSEPQEQNIHLESIIVGYAADFYISLRTSLEVKLPPSLALQLARMSYILEPAQVRHARGKIQYRNIPYTNIARALIADPCNPKLTS